eukprot:m51a1_g11208 hypothetical protein (586) ;mRNA; f:35930-38414
MAARGPAAWSASAGGSGSGSDSDEGGSAALPLYPLGPAATAATMRTAPSPSAPRPPRCTPPPPPLRRNAALHPQQQQQQQQCHASGSSGSLSGLAAPLPAPAPCQSDRMAAAMAALRSSHTAAAAAAAAAAEPPALKRRRSAGCSPPSASGAPDDDDDHGAAEGLCTPPAAPAPEPPLPAATIPGPAGALPRRPLVAPSQMPAHRRATPLLSSPLRRQQQRQHAVLIHSKLPKPCPRPVSPAAAAPVAAAAPLPPAPLPLPLQLQPQPLSASQAVQLPLAGAALLPRDEGGALDAGGDAEFRRGPWACMLRELGVRPLGEQRLGSCVAYVLACGFRSKVERLVAVAGSLSFLDASVRVVLRDPSGSMQGMVQRKVLDAHPDLTAGAVVVLRKASVYTPAPDTHILNIVDENIERVFPASLISPDSDDHTLDSLATLDELYDEMPQEPPPAPVSPRAAAAAPAAPTPGKTPRGGHAHQRTPRTPAAASSQNTERRRHTGCAAQAGAAEDPSCCRSPCTSEGAAPACIPCGPLGGPAAAGAGGGALQGFNETAHKAVLPPNYVPSSSEYDDDNDAFLAEYLAGGHVP